MNMHLRRSLRAGAGIAVLALSLTSAAAPMALAAQPAHATAHSSTAKHAQQLTINITATGGTVWGSVSVQYVYQGHTVKKTTNQAHSTFSIPRGVTVHVVQQPSSASNWPFKQWTIGQGSKNSTTGASTVAIKVTHNVQLTAVYVFQSSSSGYGGYLR